MCFPPKSGQQFQALGRKKKKFSEDFADLEGAELEDFLARLDENPGMVRAWEVLSIDRTLRTHLAAGRLAAQ